jgi:spermidine synthase
VKPWILVAQAEAPEGGTFQLLRRGEEFVIKIDGSWLMSSRTHGSEEALAEAGIDERTRARARVLVGGLGFGFTLRAALDRVGAAARVTVAEISQAVIDWNRGPLAALAGHPLRDARVSLEHGDVGACIRAARSAFEAILLDVDNGPEALTARGNRALYHAEGLAEIARALAPGGRLAVWSAGPDARFLARLKAAGLAAEARAVPARVAGARHTLFVATRAGAGPRPASRGRAR